MEPFTIANHKKRNAAGLIEDYPYVFNEDGNINWRAMVRSEFLVPNKQRTDETDITKLKDNELLILLGGLKHLAQLRGYRSVSYPTVIATQDKVTAVCRIEWLPNYETHGDEIHFEAMADATQDNTDDMTRWHLAAMAENRAFVRAVRNFLKINIVSKEEISNKQKENSSQTHQTSENVDSPNGAMTDPRTILQDACEKKNVPFEKIKAKLIKMEVSGAEDFQSIADVPKSKILELIDAVNKYKG